MLVSPERIFHLSLEIAGDGVTDDTVAINLAISEEGVVPTAARAPLIRRSFTSPRARISSALQLSSTIYICKEKLANIAS